MSLRQYLSDVPGEQEIKELQKAAMLGTAPILRVSADVKVQNIFLDFKLSPCSLCSMFSFGYFPDI
jgi:hypothetical protein